MFTQTLIALGVLTSLSTSIPLQVEKRAGGPTAIPIPSDCNITGIYPAVFSTSFKTSDAFDSAHQKYSFILGEITTNETDALTQCLEQCYGYGTGYELKSVLWSYNATHEEYGSNVTGIGCWMYDTYITKDDIIATDGSTNTEARAINIEC
jgi:hypothetical protein